MEFGKYPENWDCIIARIKERDNYICSECKQRFDSFLLRVHHMIPLSKGGSSKDNNLLTLCVNCHSLKHPHMMNRKNKIQKKNYANKYNSRFPSKISESDMLME